MPPALNSRSDRASVPYGPFVSACSSSPPSKFKCTSLPFKNTDSWLSCRTFFFSYFCFIWFIIASTELAACLA